MFLRSKLSYPCVVCTLIRVMPAVSFTVSVPRPAVGVPVFSLRHAASCLPSQRADN